MVESAIASRRAWLCVGPVVLAVTDATITLLGQRPDYWDGYASVHEHNPLADLLLRFHPFAFAAGIAVWLAIIVVAIFLLPLATARIFAFVVMFGHALGAASWLIQWRFGYLSVFILFVVVRMLTTFIWPHNTKTTKGTIGG